MEPPHSRFIVRREFVQKQEEQIRKYIEFQGMFSTYASEEHWGPQARWPARFECSFKQGSVEHYMVIDYLHALGFGSQPVEYPTIGAPPKSWMHLSVAPASMFALPTTSVMDGVRAEIVRVFTEQLETMGGTGIVTVPLDLCSDKNAMCSAIIRLQDLGYSVRETQPGGSVFVVRIRNPEADEKFAAASQLASVVDNGVSSEFIEKIRALRAQA